MVTKILHIMALAGMLCLGCISCSDETAPQQTVPDNSNGQVKIMYRIAGSSPLSRAEATPEPGWSGDWHENLITRIDLFVFTSEGACHKHIPVPLNPTVEDDQDGEYTPLTTDELTYEEVSTGNYTYYMVANCPQLADIEDTGYKLSDLERAMITPALDFDAQQASFVMDGECTRTDTDNGQTITLSFNLSRAASKICLSVVDENGSDITSQCKYRFFNYVSTGTSVMAEKEMYGEGTNQLRASMTETDAENLTPLKYEENNKHQVVFYSYPNDWFDTSKLGGETGAWTIQDYASQDPIEDINQTYILLTAPYEGEDYYYKIPVNFATYTNNDKVSFTDAELVEIRDLYRMKRNHIYDITAKIDRRGGGLDLVTRVHEWYDGGSIDINYADNYAGALNVISDTPLTTGTGEDEAYAVVYGDNNKVATFTFRMTTPAGATWTANLTNGSQFELTSTSGIASGVGVGADENDPNEGLVTFSVRPTQDYDPGTVRETELYITVTNANGERLGEQIINPDEEYPGSTTRIKIRQVSLDQWNNLQ